jgi:hypothetical protein
LYLAVLSLMRDMIDLTRGVGFNASPEYGRVVLAAPVTNVAVLTLLFAVFMILGTTLFVRRETNR